MFEEFREEAAISMGFDANVFCRTLYDRFQGVKAGRRMVNGERLYVVNGIGVKSEAGPAPEAPKAATREQRSRARRQAEVQAKYNAAEKESATARKDTGEAEDDGGYDTGIYGGEKPF